MDLERPRASAFFSPFIISMMSSCMFVRFMWSPMAKRCGLERASASLEGEGGPDVTLYKRNVQHCGVSLSEVTKWRHRAKAEL